MFNLTILGKYGPYPKSGGATSGYLLSTEDCNILLECGAGVFSRLVGKIKPENLSAVMISHLHYDHISDLGIMNYYLEKLGQIKKIPLYIPNSPKKIVRQLKLMSAFEIRFIEKTPEFSIMHVDFTFVPVDHTVKCFAVRAEYNGGRLVYSGDTRKCKNIVNLPASADLFVCDAAFLKKDASPFKPHMSVTECAEIARVNKIRTILTHINPEYDEAEIFAEATKIYNNINVAKEEETYNVVPLVAEPPKKPTEQNSDNSQQQQPQSPNVERLAEIPTAKDVPDGANDVKDQE